MMRDKGLPRLDPPWLKIDDVLFHYQRFHWFAMERCLDRLMKCHGSLDIHWCDAEWEYHFEQHNYYRDLSATFTEKKDAAFLTNDQIAELCCRMYNSRVADEQPKPSSLETPSKQLWWRRPLSFFQEMPA